MYKDHHQLLCLKAGRLKVRPSIFFGLQRAFSWSLNFLQVWYNLITENFTFLPLSFHPLLFPLDWLSYCPFSCNIQASSSFFFRSCVSSCFLLSYLASPYFSCHTPNQLLIYPLRSLRKWQLYTECFSRVVDLPVKKISYRTKYV